MLENRMVSGQGFYEPPRTRKKCILCGHWRGEGQQYMDGFVCEECECFYRDGKAADKFTHQRYVEKNFTDFVEYFLNSAEKEEMLEVFRRGYRHSGNERLEEKFCRDDPYFLESLEVKE